MFNIDEKSIADNRTLITIQDSKQKINSITKNGTVHYAMDGHNLWLTTPKIRQAYISKDPKINDYYDKIVIARNGVNIDGAYQFDNNIIFKSEVEIKKNLVVRGNFTVEGQSSVIDTPKLTIEDNVIELNRNEKAGGLTLNIAGTAINRGTKPFARYLYSEPDKAFVVDTGTTMDTAVTNTWVFKAHTENVGSFIAGELVINKKITAPLGNLTDLVVHNNASIKNLSISGSSDFIGPAVFQNTLMVYGQFTAKSNSLLEGTLTVNRTSLFKDSVTINKVLTVDETSLFKKLSTFNQGIVIGSIGANITGALNVIGNTKLTGTLEVTENSTFRKDVNVTEMLTAKNLTANTKLKTLDAEITQDLLVKRNSVLTGTLAVNNNVTITASKTTLNSITEITGDTQITAKDLRLTCASDGTKGDLTVDGDILIKKTLTVNGSTSLVGDTTLNGNLIANTITARQNFAVNALNGNGYRFWASDAYKIYMSTSSDAIGGSVNGAATSEYNMYFKMTGAGNRGFVFKNDSTSIVQIESTGKIRSIEHMFAKNSQVLRHADMGHSPVNNTAINACMVDNKHATDLVLRDGTQKMTGDLHLDTFKLRWNNDDYITYTDDAITINGDSYGGTFSFFSDGANAKSTLKTGSLILEELRLSSISQSISGIKKLDGAFGTILESKDEWLRINDTNTHTNGVFFGTSLIRTDNELQVGSNGASLKANSTLFQYKGHDVITTAGHTGMLGALNMKSQLLKFEDAQISLSSDFLTIQGRDTKGVIIRTKSGATSKDALRFDTTKATFLDNPYFGANRILHSGDTGTGNNLDADKLDGKHYTDLVNQFVDVSGDTMSGKLTMNNEISMTGDKKIIFNNSPNSYIRSGGNSNNALVLAATDSLVFYPCVDTTKSMSLKADGTLSVLGSNVLRVADCGHGKNIDADKIDGLHLSDLDNRFVNTSGDTMTGNLIITKDHPEIKINDSTARGRIIVANGISYIQAGKAGSDNAGILSLTGYNGDNLLELNVSIADRNKAKISGSKILTESDEGHGKGIDSDTLDGQHKEYFAIAGHLHDEIYTKREEVNLQSKYKIEYNSTNECLDFMYIG